MNFFFYFYNTLNFNLTTLSWTYTIILINTVLTFVLSSQANTGSRWGWRRRQGAVLWLGLSCKRRQKLFLPWPPWQWMSNSPLLKKTTGMNPTWGGGSLLSVTSRLIISAREPLSRRFFTWLIHFHHLSSQKPWRPQRVLSALRNWCFFLRKKHRAGACGCRSQRYRGMR